MFSMYIQWLDLVDLTGQILFTSWVCRYSTDDNINVCYSTDDKTYWCGFLCPHWELIKCFQRLCIVSGSLFSYFWHTVHGKHIVIFNVVRGGGGRVGGWGWGGKKVQALHTDPRLCRSMCLSLVGVNNWYLNWLPVDRNLIRERMCKDVLCVCLDKETRFSDNLQQSLEWR